MSNRVETLEGRTLFAAAPIPSDLAAEYAAVVSANAAVKVDAATVVASIKTQAATVAADLKALPKSKTNTVLTKDLKIGSSRLEATIHVGVAKYLAKAAGTFHKAELTQAAYDAKPTAANLRKETAADTAGRKVEAQIETIQDQLGDTIPTELGTLVSSISSANPTATTLNADLQSAETSLTTVFNSADSDLTTANFADGALVGEQFN